jgi:hypothetical protein
MGNIGPMAGHFDVLAETTHVRLRRTMPDPADPAPIPSPEPVPDPGGPVPTPPSDAVR